jgi:hypothetical protein
LSATASEAIVSEAIQRVLEWLDRIASALLNHHATKEYQEALRKSGVAHGQSSLSATEQETRAATLNAKFDMRTAIELAKQYNNRTLTWEKRRHWQKQLLDDYWNGSLSERLREVASQSSADTMCRTPSLAIGSATEQTIHRVLLQSKLRAEQLRAPLLVLKNIVWTVALRTASSEKQ